MATKMTANGVSTTTTPGTEQYEIFYNARRPEESIICTTTATLTGIYSPAWLPLSKSADNAVLNG